VDAGELKVSVEQPAAWSRRLTITVPADRIDRERRSAAARLARQVRLPGFRKGKVPQHVMEKRFGAAIQQQTLEKVVGEAYREAIQREGLDPITQGAVDSIDYAAGSDLTFHVDLEVRPEIELTRLGGFGVRRPAVGVGDAEVDRVMDRLREQQAVWSALEDEPPATGDRVVVDITPLRDDAGDAAPKPRRYEIELGAGQAVESIEAAIRTLRPGESGDFDVELRSDPGAESSRLEPHRIHVNLIEAKRPDLPEVDDAFARGLGEFEDLSDLRAKIRTDLEREAEDETEQAVRQELLTNILDANPFELPPSMADDYLARVLPEQEGVRAERLAEVRASARPAAERSIKRALVVQRVAELESLQATPDEIEARVAQLAERLGRPSAEVRAQLARGGRLNEIEDEITESKVFDYLKSLSTIE